MAARKSTKAIKERARIIQLTRPQCDFVQNQTYISGLLSGRGGGKTFAGAVKVLLSAKNKEPWMSISPDSGVILDTTLPTFLDVARKYKKLIRYVKSPYPRVWFRTQDGGVADIIMKSGERPEKLRGPNKAGLWIDEASVMVEDVFDIAIATLRILGSSNQVFLTMTPRGKYHWTFKKFYRPLDEYELATAEPVTIKQIGGQWFQLQPQTSLIRANTFDNPFIPEDYGDRLLSQYTAAFAQQEVYGEFVDLAGLLFSRSDFNFLDVEQVPRKAARVRYWDKAGTDGAGSYTVGVLMARDNQGRFIIENVVRAQVSAAKRRELMKQTAKIDADRYDNEVIIYCEQEGGSGGKESMDQDILMLSGFPVYRDIVSGTQVRRKDGLVLPGRAKVTRAAPFAAMVENQNVYLVRGKWNTEYLDEMIAFPESNVADQVDGSSGAFNKLAFRNLQTNYSPDQVKNDNLLSQANRLLQLQRDASRRRGTEEPNPQTKIARIAGAINHGRSN